MRKESQCLFSFFQITALNCGILCARSNFGHFLGLLSWIYEKKSLSLIFIQQDILLYLRISILHANTHPTKQNKPKQN